MGLIIINNENSFIQFNQPDSFNHCIFGLIRQCLPVLNENDIAFQIIVQTDSDAEAAALCETGADAIDIQLVRNCNDTIPIALLTGSMKTLRIATNKVLFNWPDGFPGFPFDIKDGECFYIRVVVPVIADAGDEFSDEFSDEFGSSSSPDNTFLGCSNCLQRISEPCFTSVIEYAADDNAFGFFYCGDTFMNRVRLPFYISKPQFPAERNVFRKANGVAKVLSSVIRKTLQGITDHLQQIWHQRLIIALNHDIVNIYSNHFTGSVVIDGEYQISWQEFLDYPVAQATFQVQQTPFNQRNSNCENCNESGFNLVNDTIPGLITEGQSKSINVIGNDSILCCGFTVALTFTNATYVATASIDDAGLFNVAFKTPLPTASNVKIATYKVICPDGSFAEANIFGSFTGSAGAVCCQPYNFAIDYFSYIINWLSDCIPDFGFEISIAKVSAPSIVIFATTVPGSQLHINLPSVITNNPDVYRITIISKCEGADGDPAFFNFTVYPSTQFYTTAAFGDLLEDAFQPMIPVWIAGGTTITTGVMVFLDGELTMPALGNFIASIDCIVRTLNTGLVGSPTGDFSC